MAFLTIALLVACSPAGAQELEYRGHTLEIESSGEIRTVTAMSGTTYSIPAPAAAIIDKAQRCLRGQEGASIEPGAGGGSPLVASLRVGYRSLFSSYSARSKLAIDASEGRFRITQSALGQSQPGIESGNADAYAPIPESGGDKALDALIDAESAIVDCLYR